MTFVVADVFDGVVEGEEFDAFLLGVFDFFETSRHFLFATAVNDDSALGAHAAGGADRVHGSVAAANDSYGIAFGYRCGPTVASGTHEVDAGEVFVGRKDVDEVFAGDAHETRQSGARGYENAIEAELAEVVVGKRFANDTVFYESDAHFGERVDFDVDDSIGEAEFGYAVFEYSTNLVESFVDSDFVAELNHVAGERKSGGARANDGYAFAVGGEAFRQGIRAG